MSKSIVSRSVSCFVHLNVKITLMENLALGVSGPKLSRLEKMTDEIINFRSNTNRPEDGEYMASKVRLFVV